MQINAVPSTDSGINTTGCCPRFAPEGWDSQRLRFRDKLFLRATTRAAMHVPLDMGRVFTRVLGHIAGAGARDPKAALVLSRDLSPWAGEHLFAVTQPVAGEESVRLSGDFLARVFEGPYRKVKDWEAELRRSARRGHSRPGTVWFYYTTCPKCAKAYGENYVVGVVELLPEKSPGTK